LSRRAESRAGIDETVTVLPVVAVLGVQTAVGDGLVLKRPAGAYRYETPYSDLTETPLIELIRYQEWLATGLPPHVRDQAPPDTVVATTTLVLVTSWRFAVDEVDGFALRYVVHAAYRVYGVGLNRVVAPYT
jgi:hypothetical protein